MSISFKTCPLRVCLKGDETVSGWLSGKRVRLSRGRS